MTTPPAPQQLTYAAAGVDVQAGDRAVELMKASVRATQRPEVLGGLGGFAGLFDASALRGMRRPVLATSTDGVGTKVAIAQALDRHDTIGADLVGMVVDDIVVCGAQPLFLTDYIACGRVVPERIAALVDGIARACVTAGCALLGGETAEHPGLLAPHEYDVAGAATGVVEYDDLLGPQRVQAGDAVLALASSGLHANGFSLVRAVVKAAGWTLETQLPEFGRTLGEELLEPTRIYAADLLALIQTPGVAVHALSHVTGGGLAANVARVMPIGTVAVLDRSTWQPPAIFAVLAAAGRVPAQDAEATFNQGIGFVAVLPESDVDRAIARLDGFGIPAWRVGTVIEATDTAEAARLSRVVRGAKGVDAGGAQLVGVHSSG